MRDNLSKYSILIQMIIIVVSSNMCYGMAVAPQQPPQIITYEVKSIYTYKDYCLPIKVAPVDPFIAMRTGLQTIEGVYVVHSNSQNIKAGDIILRIDEYPINNLQAYNFYISFRTAEGPIEINIIRNNVPILITDNLIKSEQMQIVAVGDKYSQYHLPGSEHLYGEEITYMSKYYAEYSGHKPCKICFPVKSYLSPKEKELGIIGLNYIAKHYYFIGREELNHEDEAKMDTLLEVAGKIDAVSRSMLPKYTYRLLNTDDVNAFALCDGEILITKGLLDVLETKDEMAAILAHETSHITEHHQLRSYQNYENMQAASKLVKEIILAAQSQNKTQEQINQERQYMEIGSDFYSSFAVSGYSRDMEKEADISALGYLIVAGYDPNGIIRILKKLKTLEENHPNYSLFKTHPPSTERIEILLKSIDEWKGKGWL